MKFNFVNFMLVLLGVIGIALIALSIFTTFVWKDSEKIFMSISLLGTATGILYIGFIVLVIKFFKKQTL